MTLRTSYSGIQTYTQCARKWYLSDIRRLGLIQSPRTGALGFGGRIHQALEEWAANGADPSETWEMLMQHEYAIEAERGGLNVDALDKEANLGRVMLEGFIPWYEEQGEDQEFEIIAVEEQLKNLLEVQTPAGETAEIHLYGKLDEVMRHRENGQIWVRDWKTTKDLEESAVSRVEASPQPRIYSRLLSSQLPGTYVAGIRYTFLRKVARSGRAKPPFWFSYDMHLSQYNVSHHMRRVSAIVGKMVDTQKALELEVDHEFAAPFNPGWWCATCPFRNPCYMMQTASMEAAEDMLADLYTERDPLERYTDEDEETGL